MTICLLESDDEEIILTEIPIWNHDFYKYCINNFDDFFKECSEKYNVIQIQNPELVVIQKKGSKNHLFHTKLYNPLYSLYYKSMHLADIIVDVGGWGTFYDIEWFIHKNYFKIISILHNNLPMNILECIGEYLQSI